MNKVKNRKVAFCTLGCKVNQYETNAMIQEFKKCEYNIVEFDEIADVYIVNTCTVTNMADRKSRQMLRKVKELNAEAILVAVGCYAQVAKEELEKIPEIDLILGTNEKKNIVSYVEKMLDENHSNVINVELDKSKNTKIQASNNNSKSNEKENNHMSIEKQSSITDVMHCEEYVDFGDVTFTEKTRAVIKVQDGCDRFCSYCIIPFARGHIRSRKPESVVSEITKIVDEGIKEVVITGIHLASYGRDLEASVEPTKNNKANQVESKTNTSKTKEFANDNAERNKLNNGYRLIDLLEEINKIDGIKRIRLRVIRAYTYYRKFCRKTIKARKNM